MRRAGKYPKLSEHLGREAVLRQHALDGVLDDELGIANALLAQLAVALATDVTGEKHVLVLLFLLTGQDDLLGVDDDHVVAGIDARRVRSLVAAADEVGCFNREAAKDLSLSID